jgi:xanthosine utilization system XapX-like protein
MRMYLFSLGAGVMVGVIYPSLCVGKSAAGVVSRRRESVMLYER